MRHIIVRTQRALMGPYSEVVLVCMYVCMCVTGLQLKYTSLRIVYVPSGTCLSWCARAHDTMEDLEDRETTTPDQRTRPEVQKTFK